MKTECAYCERIKECRIWDKTDEMVCYDCRVDFLDEEFGYKRTEYKSDLFPDINEIFATFPSIRK